MINIEKNYVFRTKLTKKKIILFQKLTSDNNPLHSDSRAAQKVGLGKPIVFGMLTSSYLSNIIGNKIPGKGAIWSGCDINFARPVYENDILTFHNKIIKISKSTRILILDTKVLNQNKELVMQAFSTVKYPDSFLKKLYYPKINFKQKKEKKLNDINIVVGASSDLGLDFSKSFQKKKK